jgi:hypothetical protein
MAISLPKGSLITINSTQLSEHNRSAMQLQREILKSDQRTVTGVMRRYFINQKRRIAISWERLPALDNQTVDGKTGRNSLKTLYESNIGNTVTVSYYEVDSNNNQTQVTFTGFIDSYEETLLKRYNSQLWDVSITLVEQ